MQTYNQQQQSVILKGIAQNILQMNVPTFEQANKLFKEFDRFLVTKVNDDLLEYIYHHFNGAFDIESFKKGLIEKNQSSKVWKPIEDIEKPITFTPTLDEEFSRDMLLIDPPSGWKYGFPKSISKAEYKSFKGNQLNNWLIKNGYPAKEIESYGDKFYVTAIG